MKGFIEVPDSENDKILISVSHIFKVYKYNDKETGICLSVRGHNNYPFNVVYTSLSYDEVLKLIDTAL